MADTLSAVFPMRYRKALLDNEVKRTVVETAKRMSEQYDMEFERMGCEICRQKGGNPCEIKHCILRYSRYELPASKPPQKQTNAAIHFIIAYAARLDDFRPSIPKQKLQEAMPAAPQ